MSFLKRVFVKADEGHIYCTCKRRVRLLTRQSSLSMCCIYLLHKSGTGEQDSVAVIDDSWNDIEINNIQLWVSSRHILHNFNPTAIYLVQRYSRSWMFVKSFLCYLCLCTFLKLTLDMTIDSTSSLKLTNISYNTREYKSPAFLF